MRRKRFFISLIVFLLCLLVYLGLPGAYAALYRKVEPTKIRSSSRYHLVPILCFHNLDGKGIYSISSEKFRYYLEAIRNDGIRVIRLRDLYRMSVENRLAAAPSIVLTIDDNYKNIVRVAAPMLREYNFPATLFVYTNGINRSPRQGLSWEDLRRLRREGFEIQNHSHTHGRFHFPARSESEEDYNLRVQKEIIESKNILENHLRGLKIYAFAFPMGYYSVNLKKRLRTAGYELLLTTDGMPANLAQPFTGIFDRYTIQKKKYIRNPEAMFRRMLSYAKRPYRENPLTDKRRPVF